MKNPKITSAIHQVENSQLGINHFYFDRKEDAERESYRTGLPYFITHRDGRIFYTIRNIQVL